MNCSYCGAELKKNHILEFQEAVVMENGDKIISPCCSVCKHTICSQDVSAGINGGQKVILLSGPCGAGKSSIGRYISQKYGYIHIDGDSVSKRVNWEIRNYRVKDRSGYLVHREVIETMKVVLGLGSVSYTHLFRKTALECAAVWGYSYPEYDRNVSRYVDGLYGIYGNGKEEAK